MIDIGNNIYLHYLIVKLSNCLIYKYYGDNKISEGQDPGSR